MRGNDVSVELKLTSTEIRACFLDYFASKGHLKVPSSSLIPRNDPTVLLTTAGMQQMIPYFLGRETPPAPRLTSAQKCFRTTDIDKVGNERTLTFFEMLGNFSVGDYFKREAIAYAWEFLTRVLELPGERLHPTVHPEDDEAPRYWSEIAGFPDEAIVRLEDNWWGPPGTSGPCGPDSEIYFDRGAQHGCGRADCKPGCECERYLEIWNLVFMQFYQDLYVELALQRDRIVEILSLEEKKFNSTLNAGLYLLNNLIQDLQRDGQHIIPGEDAFKLYDTHGFPLELTQEVAAEHGLIVDVPGFEEAMQRQQERSRATATFTQGQDEQALPELLKRVGPTEFTGYQGITDSSKVVGLIVDGIEVESVGASLVGALPQKALLVLDITPFYPESGGQIGDQGDITGPMGVFKVQDTRRPLKGLIVHYGYISEGHLRVGDSVQASVIEQRREDTMRNHSATHLLHKALRDLLCPQTEQRDSLVEPERLRFDFTCPRPLTPSELAQLDEQINRCIRADLPVHTNIKPLQEALTTGAMALFGEKYEDTVRVVSMGSSTELCGGTHCSATGQIGIYITISETSIAAGIRRIEALTW